MKIPLCYLISHAKKPAMIPLPPARFLIEIPEAPSTPLCIFKDHLKLATPECVIVNVVWQHGDRKSL